MLNSRTQSKLLRTAHAVQLDILLDQRMLGCGENIHEFALTQCMCGGEHGKSRDEFGNQSEIQQITRFRDLKQITGCFFATVSNARTESDGRFGHTSFYDFLKTRKGTTRNEENICRIDRNEITSRILSSSFLRNVHDRTLKNLQQCLLYTLTRDVTRDAGRSALSRDLVDFIDVHDTSLCALDIEVGGFVPG